MLFSTFANTKVVRQIRSIPVQQTFFRKEYFGGLLYTQRCRAPFRSRNRTGRYLQAPEPPRVFKRLREALEKDDAGACASAWTIAFDWCA